MRRPGLEFKTCISNMLIGVIGIKRSITGCDSQAMNTDH